MTTPERICEMVNQRAAAGLAKYGTTVDRTDLKLSEWVRHAQEELLDAPQYLQRVMEVYREEIEKAYREGWKTATYCQPISADEAWSKSRARRVAEGGE